VVFKHLSKAAGKQVARAAASPWLLAADVAQFGAHQAALAMDCDEQTAKKVSRGMGLATSVGVDAAVGGPVGAAADVGLWAVGELADALFG